MDTEDRQDLDRARRGDDHAFRALVERHSRYLYAVAHRVTGHGSDAEDVVQEAWLKAHRQLARFEDRSEVRTWLHRITVNCAIDFIRRRRHRELAVDPGDLADGSAGHWEADAHAGPDRLAESGQISDRVAAAMAQLTTSERAAFVLRHVEGLSIDEIGRALGLKTNATKHSVFRAVKKMRVALEPFAGVSR
ncbi:MAG: RNA polymerase sigma factor [Vicinamibacterales bacterium]